MRPVLSFLPKKLLTNPSSVYSIYLDAWIVTAAAGKTGTHLDEITEQIVWAVPKSLLLVGPGFFSFRPLIHTQRRNYGGIPCT